MSEIPEELLIRLREAFQDFYALTGQNVCLEKADENLKTTRLLFNFCMVDADERS